MVNDLWNSRHSNFHLAIVKECDLQCVPEQGELDLDTCECQCFTVYTGIRCQRNRLRETFSEAVLIVNQVMYGVSSAFYTVGSPMTATPFLAPFAEPILISFVSILEPMQLLAISGRSTLISNTTVAVNNEDNTLDEDSNNSNQIFNLLIQNNNNNTNNSSDNNSETIQERILYKDFASAFDFSLFELRVNNTKIFDIATNQTSLDRFREENSIVSIDGLGIRVAMYLGMFSSNDFNLNENNLLNNFNNLNENNNNNNNNNNSNNSNDSLTGQEYGIVFTFVGVVVVIVAVFLSYSIVALIRIRKMRTPKDRRKYFDNVIRTNIQILDVAYLGSTTAAAYQFTLAADERLIALTILASIIMIFAILLPFLYLYVLIRHWSKLDKDHTKHKFIDRRYRSVYEPYRKPMYFFGIVSLVRKFFLAIFTGTMRNFPLAQVIALEVVLIVYLVVLLILRPFRSKIRFALDIFNTVVLQIIYGIAVVFLPQVNIASIEKQSVAYVMVAIMALNVLIYIIGLGIIKLVRSLRRAKKEAGKHLSNRFGSDYGGKDDSSDDEMDNLEITVTTTN